RPSGPVVALQDGLDGQGGLVVAGAEPGRRVGAEDEGRNRPLVGDAEGVTSEDGPELPGLAARDREHGRGALRVRGRRPEGVAGRGKMDGASRGITHKG